MEWHVSRFAGGFGSSVKDVKSGMGWDSSKARYAASMVLSFWSLLFCG